MSLRFPLLAGACAALAAAACPGLGPAGLAAQSAAATRTPAAPERPALRAHRLVGPAPVIDGRLDDEAWAAAEVATGFVQREPADGAPATERTEVRIAYDAHSVYVAARMYDGRPELIVAQLSRRDNQVHSDWFHLGLDSYFDRRTAFVFGVNPLGVKHDLMVTNDRSQSAAWDAVWDVATRIDSLGWTAEFRIPLSQLRFTASEGEQAWGLQFRRRIARHNEFSFWAPLPRDAAGDVSLYGTLHGLEGLAAVRRLELMPYSVARLTRAPAEFDNPLYRANDLFGSFGADLKYSVTSGLTLNASFNPDFGQVEADPSEVNLTAFETRLQERRPLFVEGADIFQREVGEWWWGGEQLFYSRRIGRAPQRRVTAASGFVDVPLSTTLLGAAKLSGRTAGGWTIGVLDVVTAREEARVVTSGGERSSLVVEPLTNYAVASVRRDLREGGSTLGAILTSTHRRLAGEPDLQFLRSAAYAGGVDGRHRFGGGNFEAKGSLMGSHVQGSEEAMRLTQRSSVRYFQRPGAHHLVYDTTRTSLSGVAGSASLWKRGGGPWRGAADLLIRSPGFEVNDLGFQRQADRISQNSFIGFDQQHAGRVLRRWRTDVFQFSQWSFGGERVETGVGSENTFQHLRYWGGWFGAEHLHDALSTDLLRGGPAVHAPSRQNAWGGLYSDGRRPLSARLGAAAGRSPENGSGHLWVEPSVTYRPSGRMELSLAPAASRHVNAWQHVAERRVEGVPHYIVGRLDQRTASLTGRLNYTFRPALSLQLYAQPFISAGRFTHFQRLEDAHAPAAGDRFRAFSEGEISYDPDAAQYRVDLDGDGEADLSFGNRDFNFREMRANSVLRWEFRPGSTLFVVWSQGRAAEDPHGTFRLRSDARSLLTAEETNVLLVKLSYWLNR